MIVDFPKDSLAQKLWKEDYYRPSEVEDMLVKTELAEVRACLIEQAHVLWARAYRPSDMSG